MKYKGIRAFPGNLEAKKKIHLNDNSGRVSTVKIFNNVKYIKKHGKNNI